MKMIITLLFLGFLAWAGGLGWFFFQIPTEPNPAVDTTETIVVLTGAKGRIEEAVRLLVDNKAKYMLISGIGAQTKVSEVMDPAQYESLKKRISPGREARNTYGNALEAARWVRHYGFKSIRLVTSWYHIPRSMAEFKRQLPGIILTPHPVFPENFNRQTWWRNSDAFLMVVSEYNKYIAGHLRSALEY